MRHFPCTIKVIGDQTAISKLCVAWRLAMQGALWFVLKRPSQRRFVGRPETWKAVPVIGLSLRIRLQPSFSPVVISGPYVLNLLSGLKLLWPILFAGALFLMRITRFGT